ncbi:putative N-acetylated-alpha-linked acidic dipeptidase [Xylariales sp. PMI_506]|nr:putative N-acetylated-alpha-linked acidic dipeptidase [Xylariales sp. PMI_506]
MPSENPEPDYLSAPIPTYDEAIQASSSRGDWEPPRSPIDDRPDADREAQSLLPSSRRTPASGYRPPHVETDDEDSQWSLASDDEDDEGDTLRVRRDMQELEIEDPLNGSTSTTGSLWRKRIALSLPRWKWRWPLPRFTVRLPRAADATISAHIETESEGSGASRARWCTMPKLNMDSSAVLILVARLLAIFLVLGFLYLLFVSDIFSSMSRRLGGQVFEPESVRQHIQLEVNSRRLRETLQQLTGYAHIAGTEGDYALAMDVHNEFKKNGLDAVSVDEYHVYLNYPKADGRAVEILSEDGTKAIWSAKIEEEEVGGETAGRQTYAFHGLSKSGDVKGPLIYVNYGTKSDFKRLYDSGIDTRGAIALVRESGNQIDRALKVKAAEESGFAGCIIYSDPADDGYLKGEPAPKGLYMPADGVHRGSVGLLNWVIGDVLTPGWASKKGQPREKPTATKGLVQIPSIPLAWRDAKGLLQHIQGFGYPCPEEWKGGVPDVEWWSGNSSSPIVRLKNEQDEMDQHPIWNIYGKIAGQEQSEKSIIVGAHRDAWGFDGATDPGSGTAVMLELVRVFGDLLARGWRPLRTIEFMSWDAQTYNLVGSTEFVENNIDYLRKDAIAYVNIGAVAGSEFHASGSPMFNKILHKLLERVHDPLRNETLRALWDGRGAKLENLGMDGDYVAFQDIAGTSSIDLGFRGAGYPASSNYDTFGLMARVGDPEFVHHNLLSQLASLIVLELADRPVVPLDLPQYSLALGRDYGDLRKWCEEKGANSNDNSKLNLDPLRDAIKEVESTVTRFGMWEVEWEQMVVNAGGWEPNGLGARRYEYNARMALFETGLLDTEFRGGIPNRTQFVHVVHGPQLWSGGKGATFPAIRTAVLAQDWDLAQRITDKTAKLINDAGEALVAH